MSDSLPPSSPDNAPQPGDVPATVPARNVPEPQNSSKDVTAQEATAQEEETEVPHDPVALDADRAGFKFLAIGFAIFFALIAICAGIVALVMKGMGI